MKNMTDKDARETIVLEIRSLGEPQNAAVQAYDGTIERIKFEPFSLAGFEATAPDFSSTQVKEMKRIQDKELREEYMRTLQPVLVVLSTKTTSSKGSMALKFLILFFRIFILSQMVTVTGVVSGVVWISNRVFWLCVLNWLFLGALCLGMATSRAAVTYFLWVGKLLLF
jgi:hypothetical protein